MVRFYDLLQMDPQSIITIMKTQSEKTEKRRLLFALCVRAFLLVGFAMVFIVSFTWIFGQANTPMAVVAFCILLTVRFVDFGYRVWDSLFALAVVFTILLYAPVLTYLVHPGISFLIHLASLFLILFLTCDRPEMGNGGLFSFAYIYLTGNPVFHQELLNRSILCLICFIICGLVYYRKHKTKYSEISLFAKIKTTSWITFKYKWMLRICLAVSAILAIGLAINLERFMWAGFACGSLLSIYSREHKIRTRFSQRLFGVLEGSLLFYALYTLLPVSARPLIGPLGGIFLSFCVNYRHQTIMNTLGALLIASGSYGLNDSIYLRVVDTLFGICFAAVFYLVYEFFTSFYSRKS